MTITDVLMLTRVPRVSSCGLSALLELLQDTLVSTVVSSTFSELVMKVRA